MIPPPINHINDKDNMLISMYNREVPKIYARLEKVEFLAYAFFFILKTTTAVDEFKQQPIFYYYKDTI